MDRLCELVQEIAGGSNDSYVALVVSDCRQVRKQPMIVMPVGMNHVWRSCQSIP